MHPEVILDPGMTSAHRILAASCLACRRIGTHLQSRGAWRRWRLALLCAGLLASTGLAGCDKTVEQPEPAQASDARPLPAPATGTAPGPMPMPMPGPQQSSPPMPTMAPNGPAPVPRLAGAASQPGGPIPILPVGPKP